MQVIFIFLMNNLYVTAFSFAKGQPDRPASEFLIPITLTSRPPSETNPSLLSPRSSAMISFDDLKAALAPVVSGLAALDAKVASLDAKVVSLDDKVASLDAKFDVMSGKVNCLEAARANDAVRTANRLKALTASLVPLRFDATGAAWPAAVEQPPTFLALAVSGAESVPGSSVRTAWNRHKSRRFLSTAVAGYDDDGTDAEGEAGAKSRTLRLKVIEVVGGIYERIIGTVHTIN